MNTLLIKETVPHGRDGDHSRVAAALAFIKHGADLQRPIEREEFSETELPIYPLHAAAYFHTREVVQAFIDAKADLQIKDDNGDTALHWAVLKEDNAAVAESLMSASGNTLTSVANRQKALPLHYALARPGNLGVVKTLLNMGTPQDITTQTGSGETPLHVAARQPGNLAVLRELRKRGADAGIQLKTHGTTLVKEHNTPVLRNTLMSCTPLHYAALFAKDADMAGELIDMFHEFALRTFRDQGHDDAQAFPAADRETRNWVNATSYDGDTALHFAASSNNDELVEKLITAGADINVPTRWQGDTPLILAAKSGDHRIVERLLKAGATVERDPIVMHFAAQSTNSKVIKTLLEKNGSNFLHLRTTSGDSLLHFAARTPNNAATVKALLDAGLIDDINARTNVSNDGSGEETALQMAVKNPGNHEVVKLLLDAGARGDIDTRNGQDETALQIAVQQPDNLKTIRMLLAAGAHARPETEDQIPLLLHAAAHASEPGVIDALIDARADLRGKTWDGATVMHFAANSNHPAVVQKLLEAGAGAFINTPMDDGVMPLHRAAFDSNNAEVVALLLKAGADPHATVAGINALHMAVKKFSASPEVVEVLANSGIDIDQKADPGGQAFDKDSDAAKYYGMNPVQLAVQDNNDAVAYRLLRLGADPGVLDKDGSSLLHLHLKGHTGGEFFANELIDFGVDPKLGDARGNTALHLYLESHWQKPELVKLLLDSGLDVLARNDEGDAALDIAARSTSSDMKIGIIDALLKKGAHVHQPSGKNMNVLLEALSATVNTSLDEYPEMVARLKVPIIGRFIENGVAIDETDDTGRTALHLALQGNLKDTVLLLLQKNAGALVSDHRGLTAVDIATQRRSEILNSPWRALSDTAVDVSVEDSVIAAGERQKDFFGNKTIPFDVKSAMLKKILDSLEKADPQHAPIDPPTSYVLADSSDDEDPSSEARFDAARDQAIEAKRIANWDAFGHNVMVAQALYQSIHEQVPAERADIARIRNMFDKMPPSMQLDAMILLTKAQATLSDPVEKRQEVAASMQWIKALLVSNQAVMSSQKMNAALNALKAVNSGVEIESLDGMMASVLNAPGPLSPSTVGALQKTNLSARLGPTFSAIADMSDADLNWHASTVLALIDDTPTNRKLARLTAAISRCGAMQGEPNTEFLGELTRRLSDLGTKQGAFEPSRMQKTVAQLRSVRFDEALHPALKAQIDELAARDFSRPRDSVRGHF